MSFVATMNLVLPVMSDPIDFSSRRRSRQATTGSTEHFNPDRESQVGNSRSVAIANRRRVLSWYVAFAFTIALVLFGVWKLAVSD